MRDHDSDTSLTLLEQLGEQAGYHIHSAHVEQFSFFCKVLGESIFFPVARLIG